MRIKTLSYYWYLLSRFRNGPALIKALRNGLACESAIEWGGGRIDYPPGKRGLVQLILEVLIEESYTPRAFYEGKPGDTIVDAGANVGLFSLSMARRFPKSRVTALEPFAENFEYLQRNLRSAGFGPDRVSAHRLALGQSNGRGSMETDARRPLDYKVTNGDDFPIIPFSGLFDLAGADRIAFLKVDVEGSEHDAFSSVSTEDIARCDHIAVEYHDHIRPGTLDLLKQRLAPTHRFTVEQSSVPGCGMVLAKLKT